MSMLGSSRDNETKTPIRGDRTPNRTPQRTPNRYNTTPKRISTLSKPIFKPPRAPNFTALLRHEDNSNKENSFFAYNPEKEPIKAYLRIRPQSEQHYQINSTEPYLEIVNELEISMTPPEDSNAYRTRNRKPERYKFSKIFTEAIEQQEFFNKTTLPLIHDVLKGENALIFAYGVTNSGKTYSIMGTRQQPGILPRTLDVVFNSVSEFKSDTKLKPCMHNLVQAYTNPIEENREVLSQLRHDVDIMSDSPDIWESGQLPLNRDNTILAINQSYEYGIWVSFAEIYTEKIYDLLVSPDQVSKRRKALGLKYEYSSGHKYISGLKEVKVKTIEEAYAILFEGQKNRAEYSTITNYTSSRSHSIFTIRIVRVPIDEDNYVIEDPAYATVSKFSIVDLAGSERYRNTLNSGQRLKEAGNINKSLMVLGQCMETLRLNQIKSALRKKNAMVPYRHSKLTELFKSSFEGDGKAVMIVNVNPFDTGFDENSHVMKFAAVAKDVATWRRIHPNLELKDMTQTANKRLRTKPTEKKVYHSVDSFMEEDNNEDHNKFNDIEDEDEDEEEDLEDPFVDNLIVQLDDLRNKWIEAETRCTTMESEIRQQVTKETDAHVQKMEEIWMKHCKDQIDLNTAEMQEKLNSMTPDDKDIVMIREKQDLLLSTMENLNSYLNEHKLKEQRLLEKVQELEKDKQTHQDRIRQLCNELNDRDNVIKQLRLQTTSSNAIVNNTESKMEQVSKIEEVPKSDEKFERFLSLRKKLRRSIFRSEEYSHDADIILSEIERFRGVTFELVKETNMGKLMKLISQKAFQNDPYNIHARSIALFKKYAKLSLPILAPPKIGRGSMVVLSVNAGHEEELITEMRSALASLQDENMKLKQKLKSINEGHRRLKEAFDKTQQVESANMMTVSSVDTSQSNEIQNNNMIIEDIAASEDFEMEMLSPILGTAAPPNVIDEIESFEDGVLTADDSIEKVQQSEMETVEDDGFEEEISLLQQPIQPKRKRKLRM